MDIQSVLLLNTTYEPLTVLNPRRALKLLFANKAHIVENGHFSVSTVRARIKVPSVIQITYYVRKPYSKPRFSKKAVFMRDSYTCQYCGRHLPKPTMDHVIPRSKGGKTAWHNVVTACSPCNNKKGDRTIKDAGMRLISQPAEPRYLIQSDFSRKHSEKWEKYFNNGPQAVPEGVFVS